MSEQKGQNAKQNEQENSSQKQDGLNFSEQDFRNFVENFSKYLANANESKKRGNNDYNPLKAVQSPHDEVNMHSGFLASLLNTRGEHYQDDLFLRLFLQTLRLAEWFGSTKNAQVFKEKKNIDIHIFNSEKHIIIENKIWADDQDEQIARYIDAVKSENVEYKNIAVVYLSPFGREPSQDSLSLKDENIEWKINGNLLEFNENKIEYRQISYKKDILAWIEKCQKEVGNITNLNSALEFYKDIVKIITNQKESKMSIVKFFEKETDFEVAFEIFKNENEIFYAYPASIENDIRDGVKKRVGEGWKTELVSDILFVHNEKYGDNKAFMFDFEWFVFKNEKFFSCWLYFEGIRELVENYNEKNMEIYRQKLQKHLSQELNGKELIIYKNDFIYIDFKRIDKLSKSKEIFLDFIEKYADLADKLNEKLKNFKIKG